MKKCILFLLIFHLAMYIVQAQNLVNNPNFTELDSCPHSFGQIHLATGWQTDNIHSPDLYDSCDVGGFYQIPIPASCGDVVPQMDDGFAGIVTYGILPGGGAVREVISNFLVERPPVNTDIYVSMAARPRPICLIENQFSFSCFSDGLGMAVVFNDFREQIVFISDDILNEETKWTTLDACYRATGEEIRIQIRNYKTNNNTNLECDSLHEDQNASYTFIDNVVFAPFDILPDTIIVCDREQFYFENLEFYSLPLSWDDGLGVPQRTFDNSGTYTLLADANDCQLQESLEVFVIDDTAFNTEQEYAKCEGESLRLSIDVPASIQWSNGIESNSLLVSQPGTYTAAIATACETFEIHYNVLELDCNDVIYAPNIFSPNGDGLNDLLEFHINPILTIEGRLHIFDRWGNQVFEKSTVEELIWDGISPSDSALSPGVYVWVFTSSDNTIFQSGDITLIR